MKKRNIRLMAFGGSFILVICLSLFFLKTSVYAAYCGDGTNAGRAMCVDYGTENECRAYFEGIGIESRLVEYLCEVKARNHYQNVCELWIGGRTSDGGYTSTIDLGTIDFTGNGEINRNIAYYGLCSDNPNPAANVKITGGDNGSISGIGGITRKVEPDVASMPATVNVRRFIEDKDGLSTMEDGDVTRYSRTVDIYRCHGKINEAGEVVVSGTCSSQPAYITLSIRHPEGTYYARSNVAVREADGSGSDYDSTGIVTFGQTYFSTSAKVGDTKKLIFSHNPYASAKENGVSWDVNNSANLKTSGSGYQLVGRGRCGNNGTVNFVTYEPGGDTDKLIGEPRECSGYVSRSEYTVKFTQKGTYTFCEEISVKGGKARTAACAKVVVGSSTPSGSNPPGDNTVCVNWTPQSYTDSNGSAGWTSVVSKVINNTTGSGWNDSVFAKPTDSIQWAHCYYPGVQKVANSLATSADGGHDSSLGAGGTTSNTNQAISSFGIWGNSFNVSSSNLRNPIPTGISNYRDSAISSTNTGASYATGHSKVKLLADDYSVEYGSGRNKAGLTLTETDTTSEPSYAYTYATNPPHSWSCNYGESCGICGSHSCEPCSTDKDGNKTCSTCCYSCYRSTCEHSNTYYDNGRSGRASDFASVLVPYNFKTSVSVSLGNSIVYAGETATVSSLSTAVYTRRNNTLNGTYATQVDDAEIKLISYVSSSKSGVAQRGVGSGKSYNICSALGGYDECHEIDFVDGRTLNSSGNLSMGSPDGTRVDSESVSGLSGQSYNVYDGSAGKYFCVVAAVYPSSSAGVDGDLTMESSGSKSWYVSSPSCAVIAKKPSLEIWGGGLYTAGAITLNPSVKRVVKDVYDIEGDFNSQDKENTTVFGSWAELGITTNGKIKGLASGASTGLHGLTERSDGGNTLGGSKERSSVSICIRSPLTLPNFPCSTTIDPGGSKSGSMSAPTDKSSLIARFTSGEMPGVEYNTGARRVLYDTVIEKGKTIVENFSGDYFISGNITYEDGYTSLLDVPKMIIYAKNILIDCEVKRVDAVLIAKEKILTCNETDGYNSERNSHQLKINGAVITDILEAGRTYGAATGLNSGVPAEIINYDTSLYLWGAPRASVTASGKIDTVYLKEVSPRY